MLSESVTPQSEFSELNSNDDVLFAEEPTHNEAKPDDVLVEIIGVKFKPGGKTYYFSPNNITAKKGQYVIVETARGLEYGKVAVANSMVSESEFVPPLRPIVRIANDADTKHHDENILKQDEATRICNEKIIAHNLDMKLIDVQYTFDNTKLLFYFTSEGRVDFRDLVRDLAGIFRRCLGIDTQACQHLCQYGVALVHLLGNKAPFIRQRNVAVFIHFDVAAVL